jgi:hypothetical protein
MLSALAVYISGDEQNEPGPGFYRAAQRLGLLSDSATIDECRIFLARERERCFSTGATRAANGRRSHARAALSTAASGRGPRLLSERRFKQEP